MSYLIVRADVRSSDDSMDQSDHIGDSHPGPEIRRQTAIAETWEAAMRMARALSSCGQVRSGRQCVKVIRIS
jgi:hypothetical protein